MTDNRITLVIMAAGMGSRYGGLKQVDPVDEEGDKILDFSIYDAVRAGFEKVVFIIRKEHLDIFREQVGSRIEGRIEICYAFQELTDLPAGFEVPEGRTKPWGTAHAVMAARDLIGGPFAVINADDFYGRSAFEAAGSFLKELRDVNSGRPYRFAMVGFPLRNTLTENGTVSRGICTVDPEGFLKGVRERTKIEKRGNGAAYTEDGGDTWSELTGDEIASMNFWAFPAEMVRELGEFFETFLKEKVPADPMKAECYLPAVVDRMIQDGSCTVQVLKSTDQWHGVTYQADKPRIQAAIREMKQENRYPKELWI